MSDLRHLLAVAELRFAARRLRRAPGFSATVVIVLALGIAATVAMYSLVQGILLEPLPYPEADRLVRLAHTARSAGHATVDQSDATLMLYQSEARAFDGIAAWRFDDGDLRASEPEQSAIRVRGARVTANFFDVVRVRPAQGRAFEPGEDRPGNNGVVVLSYRIWQDRLHGDRAALGKQIIVNDVPRTIVGIMPPGFAYPTNHVEIWLPLALDAARTHPAVFNLTGIGRLKRGMSIQAARADLASVLRNAGDFAQGGAATAQNGSIAPEVESLQASMVGPISHLLWFVFGSVLLVFVVACTNAAGLLLVRAERAQTELAVRGALGSGLWGLLALTLSESVLLSALGGGAGVLLAAVGMRVLLSAGTALSLPRLENVEMDGPVLLFALGTTLMCGLLVSVFPLLRTRRVSIAHVIRSAGPAGGRSSQRVRNLLVVSQIALALILVASSGLLTRSFLRLTDVRPGFLAEHVVTARVLLPYARYGTGESRLHFFESWKRAVEATPGVRDVGLTDWVPLSRDRHDLTIEVENRLPVNNAAEHGIANVDADYFQALRIPLLRGRLFGAQDVTRPAEEAIVSRAFAALYWPGESPLGKRLRPLGGRWYTVVGEVGDVHYEALDEPVSDIVYLPIVTQPLTQTSASLPPALSVVVRTDAREGELLAAIRAAARALDPGVPSYNEGALSQLVRDASARARALAVLIAIASVVTSLLGAVGLYGVIAYSVSIRRRELGIRMALGARPADVSRMVSLDGLRLAGLGIIIGIVGMLTASRLLRGLLYEVSPTDVVTLTATPLALLAIAFIASWIPARRASAVHPAKALQWR